MKRQVLIADKRKELSTKYKKLIESLGHNVIVSDKLNEVFQYIQQTEPDLILVSDSIVDNISEFCKKLRVLTFNTRPVIVGISKSAELDDKLHVLEAGADDFLSEPIQSQEFKMRIYAHLRREQESNLNEKTGLPNKSYAIRELKRNIIKNNTKAFMFLSLENYFDYKSIYTDLAADRLVQTFCAIVQSSLNENDFFSQLSENEFLIITNPLCAEKIASFLIFAFDSVVEKFYSEQDAKRGYVILQGDDKEGRRAEFIHTAIGIVTNEFKTYKTTKEIFNELYNIHKLSIKPSKSSYLIDRPKISAENSINEKPYNNTILVLEEDDALSFLLATTIELQGYKVRTTLDTTPAVIILDAGNLENLSGIEKCRQLKEQFKDSFVIMTSVLHDKEKILNSGADLYLPKPYNLLVLMKWINIFSEEFNK